jgi:hypothetical protein
MTSLNLFQKLTLKDGQVVKIIEFDGDPNTKYPIKVRSDSEFVPNKRGTYVRADYWIRLEDIKTNA